MCCAAKPVATSWKITWHFLASIGVRSQVWYASGEKDPTCCPVGRSEPLHGLGTQKALPDGEIKTRWFEYNDFDACLPGGESLNDMRRRFLPLVNQTIEDASEPGIILLITHGGILEAMLPFVFENIDFNFTRTHPIGNITIVKGKLQDGRLICLEYNGKIMMQ